MGMKMLTLDNLKLLNNGLAPKLFDLAMQRVGKDLEARPTDKTARKVNIELQFVPMADSHGNLHNVVTQIQFVTKVPAEKTMPYIMNTAIGNHGCEGIMFNPDMTNDPNQRSIMDVTDPEDDDVEEPKRRGK